MRVQAACSSLLVCIALTPAYLMAEAGGDDALMLLYEDEEIINIATGTQKPIHLAPSVASVITENDIKTSGATTLDEVLDAVPGLHVSLSSLNRLKPVYSIRGIHSSQSPHVLFMMNGVPFVNTFSGSTPTLFRYPVANIQRIEIIRGPGSAVHGADAFAGVINIITKDADMLTDGAAGLRYGSFDTYDVWAQKGAELAGWNMSFSVEYQHTDGDDDRIIDADRQSILDAVTGTDVSRAPGPLDTRYDVLNNHFQFTKANWEINLWDWHMRDAGVGAGGAQALDPTGKVENDTILLDVKYRVSDFAEDWDLENRFSYYYLEEQSYNNLYPAGASIMGESFPDGMIGNPGGVAKNTMLEIAAHYDGWRNHQLRLAIGLQHQDARTNETKNFRFDSGGNLVAIPLTDVSDTDDVYMRDQSRRVWHLSAQDEWRMAPDWELTGGLRYDRYSDFGGTLNPRAALVWATDYNLTTKFLYGRAFRAPSFGELHVRNNPVLLGNEDLDPETIDTLEVVFDYRPTFDLESVLNLYTYRISDLIDYVPGTGGARAQNAKDQDGYGLELQIDWKLSKTLNVHGGFAWQRSKDSDTGATVPDTPERMLRLAARWKLPSEWVLSPQLNWVADRERAAGDGRDQIDDYTLVDLTLRRAHIRKNWEFAASIRNLFDEDAREPSHYETFPVPLAPVPGDYPLAGRSLYVELRYNGD
ncbi:MAG: TonB-dependent receptor [Pseudomonadota bacterium]